MKELTEYLEAMRKLPADVRAADVELERVEQFQLRFTNGEESGGQESSLTELYVRVQGPKGIGVLYTQKTGQQPENVLNEAYEISQYVNGKDNIYMKEAAVEEKESMREDVEAEKKQEDIMRRVLTATDRKLLERFGSLLHRELKLQRVEESREIVNLTGFSAKTGRVSYNLQVAVSAVHNGTVHMEVEDTAPTLDSLDVDGLVSQLYDGVARNMPSVVMEGGTMEAVLDARFVCDLFFMAWKLFSGPAYLQGQTATVGKLGETILPKQISIEDRCESPGGGFQYALDCEGSSGRNVKLVDRGVFTGLLHNLQSADFFHEKPTGNAGRKTTLTAAVQTDVSVIPKNLHILPGQASLEQMIQSVGEGIWLTHCFDEFHSLDVASGDFSIPGEGIRIEKGKLTGRVVDLTIEGNILQVLSGVLEVGEEICTMPLPEVRSFSVTAPAVHVSEIRISV